MSKVFTLMLGLLFITSITKAEDLFSYDKAKVETEFAALETLESYVYNNQEVTLDGLLAEESGLIAGLNLTSDVNGIEFAFGEPPLGIPSFVWGCVFGVAGIAIVYFVAEDSEETKKAFKGCVVGALTYTLFYVLFWVVIGVGAASTATI